jgi:uncharacterized protein
MKYLFGKLHAPRPDFARTLTPEEARLMQEHVAYLRPFAAKGWAVAFGPVADPAASYGVSIWTLPDMEDLAPICAGDPTIKSERGFRYEIHPMPALVTRS